MGENKTPREILIEKFSHEPDLQSSLSRVVVVSIDPSSAEYVFEWAMENYIQPTKDLVVLINSRNIDVTMAPYINPTGFVEDFDDDKREASVKLLKEYAHKLRDQHIACQAIAMVGDPKMEIIRKVKEIKADVLIMGSRKLGAIKRTLLGSVSDYVVHHCPCAVIICREKEDQVHDKSHSNRRSIFFH
ncbi:unnamed protein product [Cunninghamella blakesleeana]